MVDRRQGKPVLCTMMVDEVAICKQVDWDGHKYVGYVNLGVPVEDSRRLPVAKEALVMMTVSLTEHWKVPVAYFLIDGLPGQERANLVLLCLSKLHSAGITIVSLTFDGSSANCAMAVHLRARHHANDPSCSFPHPENPSQNVHIF